jgi:hypothetical protein
MITESVEIPRPLSEAYDRWTRDETIPEAMRGSERHGGEDGGGGETPTIRWSGKNDAPGSGTVRFEAASETTTMIVIELVPEPDAEGGHDAGPRARGLLDRFRDSFPAASGDPTTPLGGMSGRGGTEPTTQEGNQAPVPADSTADADITKTRHVPGLPSNR